MKKSKKQLRLYSMNPLDYFKGFIGFPLGYYKFKPCTLANGKPCRTCKNSGFGGEKPGWGFQFLFFGFTVI